jgi:peptidoglycan/xylan/chitin deacetylase (PgdA/CDA1 family)
MTIQERKVSMTFRIFSRLPLSLSLLGRLTRTRLIIPYYHVVSDEDILHVKHLHQYKTIRQFEEDMDSLLRIYSPVSLSEVLRCRKEGRPLPEKGFLLTFDDGYREMSDIVAPILLKKGINATFFVNTAFIDNKELSSLNKASLIVEQSQKSWSADFEKRLADPVRSHLIRFHDIASAILAMGYQQKEWLEELATRMGIDVREYLLVNEPYLTSPQIKKLIEDGFTVGSHSIDHPMYSSLSLEEQLHQTIESVRVVREMFHLSYGVFAFPFSDHGISKEFFVRLARSGLIDVSFGTAGLIEDGIPNHLQRFSLEQPMDTAERIIAFQYARKLRSLITRNSVITRSGGADGNATVSRFTVTG